MLDLGSLPLADLLGFLSSSATVILVWVALLVLCEVAVLLGALIGHLKEGDGKPHGGRMGVG